MVDAGVPGSPHLATWPHAGLISILGLRSHIATTAPAARWTRKTLGGDQTGGNSLRDFYETVNYTFVTGEAWAASTARV